MSTDGGLHVFRVISDTTNESLPEAYFSLADAVKTAKSLKETANNKLDFRVVKTVPVFSTKEIAAIEQDDLF